MTAQVHSLDLARLKERLEQVRASLHHATAEIASPLESELVDQVDELADIVWTLLVLLERPR